MFVLILPLHFVRHLDKQLKKVQSRY